MYLFEVNKLEKLYPTANVDGSALFAILHIEIVYTSSFFFLNIIFAHSRSSDRTMSRRDARVLFANNARRQSG